MKFAVVAGKAVLAWGSCAPGTLESQAGDGRIAVPVPEGIDPADCWWDSYAEALVARQDIPLVADKDSIIADNTDTAVVTGIPDGATVLVKDGAESRAADPQDGTLELSASTPGALTVVVEHHRYRPARLVIEAQ